MPTVLVEAGSACCPIVASNVGGIPDLLGGGERGIMVPARDVGALTKGIRQALSDLATANRRASRLRDWLHEHYDADHNAAILAEQYTQAIRQ